MYIYYFDEVSRHLRRMPLINIRKVYLLPLTGEPLPNSLNESSNHLEDDSLLLRIVWTIFNLVMEYIWPAFHAQKKELKMELKAVHDRLDMLEGANIPMGEHVGKQGQLTSVEVP